MAGKMAEGVVRRTNQIALRILYNPKHAGPWRRGAPKAEDGCGAAAESQLCFCLIPLLCRFRLCEADPSLAIWAPPFGTKGRRLNGQARRLIYAKLECPLQDIHLQGGTCLPVFSIVEVIPKHAGPWRRAAPKTQVHAAKPLIFHGPLRGRERSERGVLPVLHTG